MGNEKTQIPEGSVSWHPEQETETLRSEVKQRIQITEALDSEVSNQLIQEVFCTIGLREAERFSADSDIPTDERLARLNRVGQLLNAGIRESKTLASAQRVMQRYRQKLSPEDTVLILEGMLVADMITRRGRRGVAVLRCIAELEEKPLEEVTVKHATLISDVRRKLSKAYELEESTKYTDPIDRGMEDLKWVWGKEGEKYITVAEER